MAGIAVASKDISVTAHLKSISAPYSIGRPSVCEIDDPRGFAQNLISITIHQFNILASGEVCAKSMANIFDQEIDANNHIGYY